MLFHFMNFEKEKKRMRDRAKEICQSMSVEERKIADSWIQLRLFSFPYFQEAESIFTYVSMKEEPGSREIIETAWNMGKRVFVPRCFPGKERRMEAVEISSWEELSPGMMGILEPKKEIGASELKHFSLMLIPCVAADKRGGRLGHGAGYYDRFLKCAEGKKLCLCYKALLFGKVPMGKKDIFMDFLLTEEGICSCQKRK